MIIDGDDMMSCSLPYPIHTVQTSHTNDFWNSDMELMIQINHDLTKIVNVHNHTSTTIL